MPDRIFLKYTCKPKRDSPEADVLWRITIDLRINKPSDLGDMLAAMRPALFAQHPNAYALEVSEYETYLLTEE